MLSVLYKTHVESRAFSSSRSIDHDSLAQVLLYLQIACSRLQCLSGFRKVRLGPWRLLALGCRLFCRFCMFVRRLVLLLGFGGCSLDIELSSERPLTLRRKEGLATSTMLQTNLANLRPCCRTLLFSPTWLGWISLSVVWLTLTHLRPRQGTTLTVTDEAAG